MPALKLSPRSISIVGDNVQANGARHRRRRRLASSSVAVVEKIRISQSHNLTKTLSNYNLAGKKSIGESKSSKLSWNETIEGIGGREGRKCEGSWEVEKEGERREREVVNFVSFPILFFSCNSPNLSRFVFAAGFLRWKVLEKERERGIILRNIYNICNEITSMCCDLWQEFYPKKNK